MPPIHELVWFLCSQDAKPGAAADPASYFIAQSDGSVPFSIE